MCTEYYVEGKEITRSECWCPLAWEGLSPAPRELIPDAPEIQARALREARELFGRLIYEALAAKSEEAGHDSPDVTVTVTMRRW